jgi:hypothetical protein
VLLGGLRRRNMPLNLEEPRGRRRGIGPSRRRGALVARLLSGSWRCDPLVPEDMAPGDVAAVVPFLLASGCGALAWARIRTDPRLADAPECAALRDAFRYSVIDAAVGERRIAEVMECLRSADVEAMLFKGRAAAAAYGDPACRPGGDIDLLLSPKERARADAVLGEAIRRMEVDLDHDHLVNPQVLPSLFSRRGELRLGDTDVSVPGPEDHVRLLALHALCHGVARPIWLCDVAAWVESRPGDFDWSVALTGDAHTAERVRVALSLAHHLVGMRIEGTPAELMKSSPGWAESAVLRNWGDPRFAAPPRPWDTHRGLRSRARALAMRWPPDPIFEAFRNGRRFTRWPRLPYHVIDAARRTATHRRVRDQARTLDR